LTNFVGGTLLFSNPNYDDVCSSFCLDYNYESCLCRPITFCQLQCGGDCNPIGNVALEHWYGGNPTFSYNFCGDSSYFGPDGD
jgi:hypothetical protein